MNNKIILGFDVGTRKTGVAVGQTLLKQAKPLSKLVVYQDGFPNKKAILQLIKEWRPHEIVVGLPTHMDGSPQFITKLAKDFMKFLQSITDLPIHAVDERLTTKTARSDVFEQGGYKQLKKTDIDSYAAKLIVESWINEQYGF